MPNYSTIADYSKVIYLGHTANVPLIRLSTDLDDGLEPHDHICSREHARAAAVQCGSGSGRGGVYPGWWELGSTWEGGIPGTNPAGEN